MAVMPFGTWINRTWIDLSQPSQPGYLMPHGVALALRSLRHGIDLPRFSSLLMPGFRATLVAAGARSGVKVALRRPAEVPKAERSANWQDLCDLTAAASSLPLPTLDRLLWLLHRLCLHPAIASLAKDIDIDPARSTEEAWIAYTIGLADYALAQEAGRGDLAAVFAPMLGRLPHGSLPAAHASYQVAVWHAKYRPDLSLLGPALDVHRGLVEAACERQPPVESQRLRSRFHRVFAFLPQAQGDLSGMVAELEAAEAYARSVPRDTDADGFVADKILWPLMETRIREAELLDDAALTERRARDLVAFTPGQVYAYLHLGKALADNSKFEEAASVYRQAVRLGPPCSEIALFNLGQCLEFLGDSDAACDCYVELLDLDPLAISAAERLHSLAAPDGVYSVWAAEHLDALQQQRMVLAAAA